MTRSGSNTTSKVLIRLTGRRKHGARVMLLSSQPNCNFASEHTVKFCLSMYGTMMWSAEHCYKISCISNEGKISNSLHRHQHRHRKHRRSLNLRSEEALAAVGSTRWVELEVEPVARSRREEETCASSAVRDEPFVLFFLVRRLVETMI